MTARETPATARRRHKGLFGHTSHFERGAAAVEMALVLPVLLFLLMGIIDFGRAYSAQIQLSQAAREGVRLAALNTTGVTTGTTAANPYGDQAILDRVQAAAGGVSGTLSAATTYCSVPPGASQTAKVVVTLTPFTWITGISGMSKFFGSGAFPTPTTLQSTGVMRCTG